MKNHALIAVTVFSILFAVYVNVQRILLDGGIHPLYLNALTYITAAVIFSSYLLFRSPRSFHLSSKKGTVFGVLSSLLAAVVADLLVVYGLRVGSPISWSILSTMSTIGTYLLAVAFLGEQFLPRKIVAVVGSITGAIFVLYTPGIGVDFRQGAVFFLLAVGLFSMANVVTQTALRYLTTQQLTFVRLTTAAVSLAGILVVVHPTLQVVNWALVIFNGIVLLVAIELINIIMKEKGASFFSVASNIAPVFVVLLSIIMRNEWPTLFQIGGGAVIIGSILLFQSRAARSTHVRK